MHLNVGYLGLALVLVGATLLASPTLGFETIAADRSTDISTTDDLNALLGVDDNSASNDADIQNKNDQSVLYYLDDNAGEFPQATDLQANVVSSPGEVSGLSASIQPSDSEHDYELVVDCGSGKDQGTVTVSIEATGSVSVEMERTTTDTIDINCGGGGAGGTGPANFVANDVASDGTQTFSFDGAAIKNKDTITIDLSDAHGSLVDYPSDDSSVSVNKSVNSITIQNGVIEIEAGKNWKGSVGVTVTDIHPRQGDTATAEYQDDSGKDNSGRSSSDEFRTPVVTSGDANLGPGATVAAIDSDGSVTADARLDVDGSVSAVEDLTTGNRAQIDGPITVGGSIDMGQETTITGDVTADGAVEYGIGSYVEGDISAGGDVTLDQRVEIDGNLDTDGTLYICDNANVRGDITAEDGVVEQQC